MTPSEFIANYDKLAREARDISSQIKPSTDRLDEIEAAQADLSKTPEILESVTPLRAGQTIETALHHQDGSVDWSVAHVIAVYGVHLTYHGPADGLEVYVAVYRGSDEPRYPTHVMLYPQPGHQWRYPEAACAASLGGGKEDR